MDYIQKAKSDETPVFKLVVAGSSGVGKTTFVNSFLQLMKFNHNVKPKTSIVEDIRKVKSPTTIACDLNVVDIDIRLDCLSINGGESSLKTSSTSSNESEKTVKLHIYDTAGAETFHAITLSYFRGAHCVLLFFDLNDMRSLQQVRSWKKTINRLDSNDMDSSSSVAGRPPCTFILIGTKLDDCFTSESNFNDLAAYLDTWSLPLYREAPKTMSNTNLQCKKFREIQQCLYVNVDRPVRSTSEGHRYPTAADLYETQKHQQRHPIAISIEKQEEKQPLLSQRDVPDIPRQWSKFVVGSIYEKFTQLIDRGYTTKDHIIIDLLRKMELFKNNRPVEINKNPNDNDMLRIASGLQNIQLIAEIMLQEEDCLFVPFTSANRGYNVIETMELIVKHVSHINRTFSIVKNLEVSDIIVLGKSPSTTVGEKEMYYKKCCV